MRSSAEHVESVESRRQQSRPKPWSIVEMENLAPGQEYIFYRGNLQIDLKMCTGDNGAPEYLKLLLQVHERAVQLAEEGS